MADRPDDLVDVTPNGYITTDQPKSDTQTSLLPNDLISVDPDYVAKQVNPYNPVTGTAAVVGMVKPGLEKTFGSDATERRSMEKYLRTQIHHEYPGLDLAALKKEFQNLYGPKARITTYSQLQDALRALKGDTPGQTTVDLSPYETTPKPTTTAGKITEPLKKVGEVVENINPLFGTERSPFISSRLMRSAGRGALGFGAGYEGSQAFNKAIEGDVAGAVPSASSAAGYGLLLAANPKLKGLGAILAALPLVGKLTGSAQAAPLRPEEVAGTAVDLVTGLMAPSELGQGTIRPRDEAYYPGMKVLEGSRLPKYKKGGLAALKKKK